MRIANIEVFFLRYEYPQELQYEFTGGRVARPGLRLCRALRLEDGCRVRRGRAAVADRRAWPAHPLPHPGRGPRIPLGNRPARSIGKQGECRRPPAIYT